MGRNKNNKNGKKGSSYIQNNNSKSKKSNNNGNRNNNFKSKKIKGIKKASEFLPFYIGRLDKKRQSFGFVEPIDIEEIRKIKSEVDLSYFSKKENYNIQNIKELKESIHINLENMGTANDKDIVLINILNSKDILKPEGRIKYVLKRQKTTMVCKFQLPSHGNFGFAIPDDKTFISDIFIPKKEIFGAKDGDKVLVEVTKYVNNKSANSEGKVVKIVARSGENYIELKSLLAENGIEEEFSNDIMFEAQNMPTEVLEEDKKGRVDLRNIRTYTIDGEDAKDLDDAVSISKKENYLVYISIADVSHYVKENMAMDNEAVSRGNSIYLIDTVIPMLPTALSNDICSLNANVDRLAMTVEAEIDNNGNIVRYDIYKSVINVARRMSYTEVQNILDKKQEDADYNDFKLFEKLANILIKRRQKNGYINFDVPETEIVLDEKGKAIDVREKTRYFSNKIIEHLMLTANEIVAEHYDKLGLPVIYRVHETPDPDRVEVINEQLSEYGVKINVFSKENSNKNTSDSNNLKDEKYIPQKEYIRIVNEIEKKKQVQQAKIDNGTLDISKDSSEYIDYTYISYLLLRSMKKAKYLEKNLGHYGIGSNYYLHFTSPIRRYSDLFTHRIMTKYLENKEYFTPEKISEYYQKAQVISEVISETEKLAVDMERKYDEIKIAEYAKTFVGKTFTGTVVSKTNFGAFINIGKDIEGLVRKNNEFDTSTLKIGQLVNVLVTNVNKDEGDIDLKVIIKKEEE